MAEKLDPKEEVNLEEVVTSNMLEIEALINILDRKGIITKEEILEEIKQMRVSLSKAE